MKITSILASSLLLLTAQGISARQHHEMLAARDNTIHELQTRQSNILLPGQVWGINEPAKATSYIPDAPLTGACGFGGMPRQKKNGGLVFGAAQMYSVFGSGKSCGTCLRLNATERHLYGDIGTFDVHVSNSCPGICSSLDLEVDGIESWLKRKRVGELGIVGEVVPCNFKENEIFIEVYQRTTTKYDTRFQIRGNSGAMSLVEIGCAGSNTFLPMGKPSPDQYTLNDMSKSATLLPCKSLDFRVSNFAKETIILASVPNKLFNMAAANQWYNTRDNFEKT